MPYVRPFMAWAAMNSFVRSFPATFFAVQSVRSTRFAVGLTWAYSFTVPWATRRSGTSPAMNREFTIR